MFTFTIRRARNVYCCITGAAFDHDETPVGEAETVAGAWAVVEAELSDPLFDSDDEWIVVRCTGSGAVVDYLRPGITADKFALYVKQATERAERRAKARPAF